jgi:ABC-type glycerol-3-phosphate transport system substrate-binding protein
MDAKFTSTLVPAYKGGELQGKMVGLVWSPNPWVLVYNKELAKRAGVSGAPKDFNDFNQQANAITKLDGKPFGAGFQLNLDEYSADTFHILMWQTGGDMLDQSLKSAVSSAGTIKAVNLVKDYVDRKAAPFGRTPATCAHFSPRTRSGSSSRARGSRGFWTGRACRATSGTFPRGRGMSSPPPTSSACRRTPRTRTWHGT